MEEPELVAFGIEDWYSADLVQVAWNDEFGPTGTPVHQWLGDHIGRIRGVDSVTVHRYHLLARVVPRVRGAGGIIGEICDLLEQSQDLAALIADHRSPKPLATIRVVAGAV